MLQAITATQAPARGGTEAAADYEAIYDEHFDFVWRNVRRLGVPEESADDAVQDVFLVVHRKLREFEGRSSMRTWLFGILARVARDYRRTRARAAAKAMAIAAESVHEPAETPVELVAKREAARVLEDLLSELDDDKREVLVLVELEQSSVAEVAIALGLNPNTAHARLRAARQQFEAAVARFHAREKK
jgi:RNA polymerase sigma-70 factor (ECF subfamily)